MFPIVWLGNKNIEKKLTAHRTTQNYGTYILFTRVARSNRPWTWPTAMPMPTASGAGDMWAAMP